MRSTGEAGMHRSEAEGRFGAAEPEGRAIVCAELFWQPSEFLTTARSARYGNKTEAGQHCKGDVQITSLHA